MKVGNASICLTCDEIYVRNSRDMGCPACGEMKSIPLAKYFPPMKLFRENDKENKNEK